MTITKLFIALTMAVSVLALPARAIELLPETPAVYECEGDACSQVTLTWDNDRQQFRVQNDSDRRVKVSVTTFAGDSSVRVEPHTSNYLEVKTFNGPYRANYE